MDFEFKIGTPVLSRDEREIGKLKYLVIDPDDETISNLVVEKGLLLRKDVVVPVSWVVKADEERIFVNATASEVDSLPEFREVDYRQPDPTARPIAGHQPSELRIWDRPYINPVRPDAGPARPILVRSERPWVEYKGFLGVNDDEVLLKRGQPIYASDGQRVATLDHVVADDETHRIQELVVHRGHWLQRGEDVVVPADAVSSISHDEIRLSLSRDELDQLARYRAPMGDSQLEAAITRGLQTLPETKGQNLNVQVDRGVARLFGEATDGAASAAASIAKQMQGVIGVEDHTARPQSAAPRGGASGTQSPKDAAIAAQITDAYQRQNQQDLSGVRVQVDKGVAYLTGTTRNIAGKALAEQIARDTPGVASVVSGIEADTVVRARVEAALAEDPRTSLIPVDVMSRAGVVTLLGQVPSFEAKKAIEEVARKTAGVKAVISELEVRPPNKEDRTFRPVALQVPRSG
jgi:osmotically-inducible protein OsmY/sporulation protein YlmC with PRC-barrel domain